MAISDYSTTANSNTAISGIDIAENCLPSGINNAFRQLMADVRTFANGGSALVEVTVASGTPASGAPDILGAASNLVCISGTTTVTSLGTGANKLKHLRFSGALILTHNATSLILPGGANITTAAGDTCIVVSDASSNCRIFAYQRANGWVYLPDAGRIVFAAAVNITHSTNVLTFAGASGGYKFDAMVQPTVDDGASLGVAAFKWSDLFLGNGGVINWANGDVTLTHSAATLAIAGSAGLHYLVPEYGADDADGTNILFRKTRGTIASKTIVSSGDSLGKFFGQGWDGNSYADAALISFEVDGTPGDGDMPGRISFWTTPDGSGTLAERLRIQQSGVLLFGAASFQANGTGTVTISNVAPAGAATATITKWLRIDDASGTDSYIPVWQ